MTDLTRLRHQLHQYPELSGQESATADRIKAFFKKLAPDLLLDDLGGHGVAVVFRGRQPGPTVLLRCELDALPIEEASQAAFRSAREGVSHQCGHDGHMAILAAVGAKLAEKRPSRGRVVLLYQPAEETGKGAAAVIADPRFERLTPDFTFALHNLPGFPLGQIIVRDGVFSSASRGIAITLTGATAHAAQPETGRSPARAMSQIIEQLSDLPRDKLAEEMAFATVVGARLGERAFGTAPGSAEIWATLRSDSDEGMQRLVGQAEALVVQAAAADRLGYEIHYDDVFDATVNARPAVDIIRGCVDSHSLLECERPFRWSEDFGRFTARCPGALFGLGAGETQPDLHDRHYVFPDALIPVGAALFLRIVSACLEPDGHT